MKPATAIIDAHVHLWNPAEFPIPWLKDQPVLNQAYDLPAFQQQSAGWNIAGMVYVEVDVAPHFALLEAQHVVALAAQEPRLQGVVAAAPLEFGVLNRRLLDALAALGPLIKGVRRNLQGVTDPAFFQKPALVQGLRLLADYGYSFDICIHHDQLPAITALVRQCPDVTFILDHMAKPNIREHLLDPWRADIAALAALPNVACKISGLLTEADPQHWQPADLAPYIDHVIATFGPQRILYGGDWPVLRLAGSYTQWVEVLMARMAALPESAQQAFWHANARRLYRLEQAR